MFMKDYDDATRFSIAYSYDKWLYHYSNFVIF